MKMNINIFRAIIFLSAFLIGVNGLANEGGGDDDKKTTTPKTSIWTTVTKDGSKVPIHTVYSQSFMSTHKTVKSDSIESGGIGLGSSRSDGQVGQIRSYERTTVSDSNNNAAIGSVEVYSGLFGVLAIGIGLL